MQHYTYKLRCYPTKEQQVLLEKHFGCARFVYNYILNEKIENYKKDKSSSSYFDDANRLPEMKKEFDWLKEVGNASLQQSLRNLDSAYKRFFKLKLGFPKFKSKHKKKSVTFSQRNKVKENTLYVEKFREGLKLCDHREVVGKVKNVTISKAPSGKYFAAILVEKELQTLPVSDNIIGVDLGIKTLAVTSNGDQYDNPRTYKKLEKKLARLARRLARKKKGSNNRAKAKVTLARHHERIANVRNDFLHNVTTKLINENQVICLEDLNVSGMVKNRKLAKHIADASFCEFRRKIEYKARWRGRTVLFVDRFYPSSKTCSNCGEKNKDLKLSDRTWTCSSCKAVLDRDLNAAINIRNECSNTAAMAGIHACGDKVRLEFPAVSLKQENYKGN